MILDITVALVTGISFYESRTLLLTESACRSDDDVSGHRPSCEIQHSCYNPLIYL